MNKKNLETAIMSRGKELFDIIGSEKPSLFNKNRWIGTVMDWSMDHDDFKIQLFRFIDVLPYLTTEDMLAHHIQEYFSKDKNVPAILRLGAKGAGLGGKFGLKVLGKMIRKNLEMMALQFIIGGNVDETCGNLKKLRDKGGFAFTLDILGETTISEKEASDYVNGYLELIEGLSKAQKNWKPLGGGGGGQGDDWGHAKKINISIKPSALYSQSDPADFEGTVSNMVEKLKPVYRKVLEADGFLCIDTETKALKHVIFELYKRLRSDPEFREHPNLGLALQVYHTESDKDVKSILDWAKNEKLPISLRLVKGAYWDYEIVIAKQHGWDMPLYTIKAESDAAFERAAEMILENHDICHLACASHNVRSVCAVLEIAKALNVPHECYEFQVLYGMAEPFRKALLKVTNRVRLYCPHGQLLPGMAYFIRRLLENTSNESFLKQSFVDGIAREKLLEDPVLAVERALAPGSQVSADAPENKFTNEPLADCSKDTTRAEFVNAIADVRTKLGKTCPLYINGNMVQTDETINSVNPNDPDEIIVKVSQAGIEETNKAIEAANTAFKTWRDTPAKERAAYMFKAAKIARTRAFELSAWQILEAGKQWRQAYNDVAEAIDFLDYYAHEMIRLDDTKYMGRCPDEVNQYFYQPKGVTAVIAPWNFPLAISCGMAAAAIVTGNCVVYKPSNQTPMVGFNLVEIFKEAGLPAGVFNYVPGKGSVMGDYLTEHPKVSMVAFTGSMEVGLRIIEKTAKTPENQPYVKSVIAEMGGKNAIIIDDDGDLDEAIPAVLDSAFMFQGQKCSACSRVIVLDSIYDKFIERLLDAAKSLKVGTPEDPANFMGAVIDSAAQKNILDYIDIAAREGKIVYSGPVEPKGYYVPMTIVEGITPKDRIAQEEIFGPVLAVMRAKDLDQAIEWANSTRFALTGAIFSRSPQHIDMARKDFRVGNLYINRGSTGALVERQPFGGFKMSGVGSKAGGPDYLLQFMDPRVITENTMRRGFVPIKSDDDWV